MLRALCFFAVVATATPASADILKVFGELHLGGASGSGTGGDEAIKNSAFFANAPHFTYGAEVGLQVLFLNALIEHDQYTDGSRVATWTQFGLGTHGSIDLVSDVFVELGFTGWFGLGTGQQVSPPLDNAQITDKAVLLEARGGVGMHLNSILDVGVSVPVSWGYFFKNGNGASVTDTSTHYQSIQAAGLLVLRASLGV